MRERLLFNSFKQKNIIPLKSLSAVLNLSDRTIRTEITLLNKSGKDNGFNIINVRGKGYKLQVTDEEKFEKFDMKINIPSAYDNCSQEERVNKIVEILLISNKKLTIDYIAEKVGYSRSTVIKDLDIVEKRIKGLNLKLEKKANKGLRLLNDEISIRKSLSVYLYNNEKDLIMGNDKNFEVFSKVKKIFIKEIIDSDIDISNLAIENIFCHLKILILRINNKSFIKEFGSFEYLDQRFFNISKEICACITENLNIEIPKIELEYLASQICYKSRTIMQADEIKARAMKDINDILESLDNKFYTNFKTDIELKNNLLIHLCALISRARNNTQLKNPYFDEVNTRYSAVVSLVVNFTDEFCSRWDLKLLKDEIAFITIHFATHFEKARLNLLRDIKKIAIVCPRDGGIQYFLRLKLEENFRNVVIDNYSHLQISLLDSSKYNFIITDKDLEISNNTTPIFKVKNLFDEKEIEGIVEVIENLIRSNNEDEKEKLDGILFRREQGGKNIDYKNFLKAEAIKLSELGVCREDFANCVLKREEILSTAYKNNIAAPHGIEMNAYKNFLSTIIFDNPIDWGDKKISIVFFIAMRKGNLELHKTIAEKIFNLINDEEKRFIMSDINNKVDFIEFFEKI